MMMVTPYFMYRCKQGVMVFSGIATIVSIVLLILHPGSRGKPLSFFLDVELIPFLLIFVGSYPALAGLSSWQAEKSQAACVVLLAGALAMGVLCFFSWLMIVDFWTDPLVLFVVLAAAMYQWGIVALLAIVLLIMTLSGRRKLD